MNEQYSTYYCPTSIASFFVIDKTKTEESDTLFAFLDVPEVRELTRKQQCIDSDHKFQLPFWCSHICVHLLFIKNLSLITTFLNKIK